MMSANPEPTFDGGLCDDGVRVPVDLLGVQGREYAARHGHRVSDDRRELHTLQHVASQVDARRIFNQLDALRSESKHGTFRDVAHALTALDRLRAAERDAGDVLDELGDLTMRSDRKLAVLELHPGSLRVE